MKRLEKFIRALHELPEEIRRLLSTLLLAAVAIILFVSWGAAVSSRLAVISETPNAALETLKQSRQTAEQNSSAPSLFSGLRESLQSVFEKLAPAEKTQDETGQGFFARLETVFLTGFAKGAAFIEKIITTLEKLMSSLGEFFLNWKIY